jgi:signal transduction histidine kinase
LQEALNNVVRHAEAQEAFVRVKEIGSNMILEVEDCGKGMQETRGHRGIGFVAMAERADLIGGRLQLETGAHKGVLVRLSAPLRGTHRPCCGINQS